MKLAKRTRMSGRSSRFGRAGGRSELLGLALACVLLLTAGSAQAIYVDLSADTSHASDASAYRFHTQRISDKIDIDVLGGGSTFLSRKLKVIDFDESVVLNSIDMEGFGKVAKVYTDDGIHVIKRSEDLELLRVHRIELTIWDFGDWAEHAIGIDVDLPGVPSQAIPEPGAALLFGAGLVTIGVARRPRDRR